MQSAEDSEAPPQPEAGSKLTQAGSTSHQPQAEQSEQPDLIEHASFQVGSEGVLRSTIRALLQLQLEGVQADGSPSPPRY